MAYVSLVIPCFNEAASLPSLIARCKASFAAHDDIEVLLVDNGSQDATPSILPELLHGQTQIRSLRVDVNRGYGHGILQGLRSASGRYIGWTHADMQTDPADILQALPQLKAAGDLYIKGRRQGRPLADRVFTAGMGLFESLLLRSPLWDINAQPNLFPRTFFESWRNPPLDFSLDLFAYHQALRAGLQIKRIPVAFGQRAHGVSHWNVNWRGKWKFIKRTLDFSLELHRSLER